MAQKFDKRKDSFDRVFEKFLEGRSRETQELLKAFGEYPELFEIFRNLTRRKYEAANKNDVKALEEIADEEERLFREYEQKD